MSYRSYREAAREAGFVGSFDGACEDAMRWRGVTPSQASEEAWNQAAEYVYAETVETVANQAQDG